MTTLATISGLVKIWGLALGNFKNTGTFGAYYVAQPTSGDRHVRRLKKVAGSYVDEPFATLPTGNKARSAAFDPISGDLFVSEDSAYSPLGGDQARIWRISNTGLVRMFGRRFNKPNGIAFYPSGVILVVEEWPEDSEYGNVLAVGGWRTFFKRGDANGDGAVDISDPILINNWLFQGGNVPPCLDGADANDDSKVLGPDADYILSYLFEGGPEPLAPGPYTCGRDPSDDLLDCTKCLTPGCAIQ